jgi:hypothetical protein
MEKTFKLGKIAYYGKAKRHAVELEVELKKGTRTALHWDTLEPVEGTDQFLFTASACIWNHKHSDIYCGGQCLDTINETFKRVNPIFKKIYPIWKKYHLNDLKSGTKKQIEALDQYQFKSGRYDYIEACEYLKSIDLYDDRGYKYGSAWLYQPLPEDVLQTILDVLQADIKDI